jgi:carboxypeptidase family protein
MRATRFAPILILVLALAVVAAAEETITISGSVTNATLGKPAAGVTVTLVDPLGGMAEVATTKANAQGQFSFKAPPARGPRLLRAERAGVNYFKMIPPGVNSAELEVYDSASRVEGITGTADVLRLAAQDGTLQAAEVFVLSNKSQPPRTLAAPTTFEFFLPDGAQIDEVHAQSPNGQPITVEAKPSGQKNGYAFSFALKPGETKFQLNYHAPYSGQASVSPHLTRDFEHFVVVTPAGMTFSPKDPNQFKGMDSGQPGSNVQVSMQAKAGQELGYTISGTGSYPAEGEESASAAAPSANGRDNAPRPGGGLGAPIDIPDGLAQYRWYILAGLMTILVGGGIWTHERSSLEQAAMAGAASAAAQRAASAPAPRVDAPVPQRGAHRAPASSTAAAPPVAQPAPSSALLAGLKEEIFALEVEHQQGKLSQAEYEKARAALEQTLQRALSRSQS